MMKPEIILNAVGRATHFSNSMDWFAQTLKTNEPFAQNFMTLAKELVECARTDKSIKQVFFIAVGKSAQVAQTAVAMLASVGILARFVHPTEAFHGDLGVIGESDCVVVISNNGSSSELTQLLPGLLERKVTLFALTAKIDSPVAKAAQYVLQIPPFEEKCPLAQAPITSTLTSLALCQLLVAATVEMRNYTVENYARNHPGGAIGKRIFLKADSLMIQGKELPVVQKSDLFQTLISTFTKHSKAAVLVLENGKFVGLVTEKDLRQAMEKHGPSVFELTVQDVMNRNPKIIEPGLLAIDVFRVMNSKNPPYNLLPVVDENGFAVGLVRLLDFIAVGITL